MSKRNFKVWCPHLNWISNAKIGFCTCNYDCAIKNLTGVSSYKCVYCMDIDRDVKL